MEFKLENFNNLIDIEYKFYEVLFNKNENIVVFKLHYLSDVFSRDNKQKLAEKLRELLSLDIKLEVKAKKYYVDEDVIKTYIKTFFKKKYVSIHSQLNNNSIKIIKENDKYMCELNLKKSQIEYLTVNGFENDCYDYFKNILFNELELKFLEEKSDNSKELEKIKQKKLEEFVFSETSLQTIVHFPIEIEKDVVGHVAVSSAVSIESIKTNAENVVIAGIVNYLSKNFYTPKSEKSKPEPKQKEYFTFEVKEDFASCRCVAFPRSADVEKFSQLANGDSVALLGNMEVEEGRRQFKVKSVALCKILKTSTEPVSKSAAENYIFVSPTPYVSMEQTNLFDEQVLYSDYILENEFVVFDVETTGIDYSVEDIIEIGAVKLQNGKIVESFSTLVKPTKIISEEITNITGITNEMVANAPSIAQVLPDFYKFANGAVLVAYNIDFDYKFINKFSRPLGFKFDGKQIDALYLARANMPGLKNYKLKSVVEKLGLTLDNAHRALNDTVATAKVFLKLSKHIKN